MKTLLTLIALALLLVSCEKEEPITKEAEIVEPIKPTELKKYNVVITFYKNAIFTHDVEKRIMTENDTLYRTGGDMAYCLKWTAKDSVISEVIRTRQKIRMNLNKITKRFEIVKIK